MNVLIHRLQLDVLKMLNVVIYQHILYASVSPVLKVTVKNFVQVTCISILVIISVKNLSNLIYFLLDINECERPGACGINTNCINVPGNYSCECLDGYEGNPHDGVS